MTSGCGGGLEAAHKEEARRASNHAATAGSAAPESWLASAADVAPFAATLALMKPIILFRALHKGERVASLGALVFRSY